MWLVYVHVHTHVCTYKPVTELDFGDVRRIMVIIDFHILNSLEWACFAFIQWILLPFFIALRQRKPSPRLCKVPTVIVARQNWVWGREWKYHRENASATQMWAEHMSICVRIHTPHTHTHINTHTVCFSHIPFCHIIKKVVLWEKDPANNTQMLYKYSQWFACWMLIHSAQ